ncbi:hypothetical protein FQN54_003545 [Arachnomyces sp. PD_36]|nr:hypothetical protein FQN54_003545 [Arachnomyces sp. PD_36]
MAAPNEDQDHPTAAQVSLQTFQLPSFPSEPSSNLKSLTLTSDIKPTDYSSLVTTPSSIPIPDSFPPTIESLTLELFSLGYPANFLTSLAKSTENLKSLTLYSQLIDGVNDASRQDAGEFMNSALIGNESNGGGLRELHLLDVFSRKGFVLGLGSILEHIPEEKSVLRFLEISYTYRGHSDPEFLNRVLGDELPALLVPSLIAASFNLSTADAPPTGEGEGEGDALPNDPADVDENGVPIPGRRPEGIMPWSKTSVGTTMLVRKLSGPVEEREEGEDKDKGGGEREAGSGPGPRSLKLLDSTFYAIDVPQFKRIVAAQKGLSVLSSSVVVSPDDSWKRGFLEALRGGKDLEIVEIVGVPNEEFDKEATSSSISFLEKIFPSSEEMETLSSGDCPKLQSFNMTILRAASFGSVDWNRSPGGKWVGGIMEGK